MNLKFTGRHDAPDVFLHRIEKAGVDVLVARALVWSADDACTHIDLHMSPAGKAPTEKEVEQFHDLRHVLTASFEMRKALEGLLEIAEQRGYQPDWLTDARAAVAKARGQA